MKESKGALEIQKTKLLMESVNNNINNNVAIVATSQATHGNNPQFVFSFSDGKILKTNRDGRNIEGEDEKYQSLMSNFFQNRESKVNEEGLGYVPNAAKVINEEIQKLTEAKSYLKNSDVPQEILNWATSILGRGFQNNITLEKAEGKVTIGMPWHDADRETHQFFKLTDNGASIAGDPVGRSGWSEVNQGDEYGTVEIPSGFILATAGTYPKRLKLTVADDAMDMLSDYNVDEISDDAMVALYQAKSYKSPYRQKFNPEVYEELVNHGYLKPNKAITIDGKSIISSEQAKERLSKIRKEDDEKNGWNTKYKLS